MTEMRRFRAASPTLGGAEAGHSGTGCQRRGRRAAQERGTEPGESFQVLGPLLLRNRALGPRGLIGQGP